ncbi:peptidoglycan DD-metalloendopeptidase family protein [Lentzea flaviverrucosa]|uniref:Peptidase family M23 n=1 Tax=Lentzea flaviverrucosa TaxID=200379 RepID=A0A1H9XSX1_9PSEU|nr:peptidoglycan DD-metalloendopeptidase family protein [Lentzea flaviverrucosa]RDI19260.1 peptidase M23-like protein [Lentzea flaviverrucosa]SES49226.1 Peptidase family M23 [Lentzea flaviverrucosa]
MHLTRTATVRPLLLAAAVAASSLAFPVAAHAAAPALELPFVCGTSWKGNSNGSSAHRNNEIDFNMTGTSGDEDKGKPVVAAAAGTVRWEGGESSDYGNYVEIDHGGGYSTLYAHLDQKSVGVGDTIHQGELIGTVGNTDGNTSGISAHLHFEFRNRGSGQSYPAYIRPASFHGDPFDYAGGTETFVSQNCGTQAPPTMPGVSSVSRADGSIDVFATTSDNRLKHRNFSAGKWSCWATLPGNAKIKGDPAAVVSANGARIDVFAQGIDNRLKKLTWISGQQWYDWADLGTYTITSSPAVTMRYTTGFDVFARNAANKIVYRHFSIAEGWVNDWTAIGQNAATVSSSSAPAAVASADGTRMNVFARSADGSLLTLMWTSSAGWYNWADRGLAIIGRPAATTRAGTSVDLLLRHYDSSLIQWYSPDGADYTTYKPQDFGGYITTSPTAVTWGSQRMDVFSRNSNGDLIQKFWTAASSWTPYIGLGPVGAPAC